MKYMAKYLLIMLLGVLITGCNLIGGTSYYETLEVQINGTEFSHAASEAISASFKNISSDDLYYAQPAPSYIQVLENGNWKTIGPWYIHPLVGPYLVPLENEGIMYSGLKSDELVLEVGKTYRIAVLFYHTKDFDDRVHLSQRTTKPFNILP